jgi:hypothetical protein
VKRYDLNATELVWAEWSHKQEEQIQMEGFGLVKWVLREVNQAK